MLRALVAVVAVCAAACAGAHARPFAAPHAASGAARLVVVGDLQSTAPVLELWREKNDAERAIVVRGIADERPDLVAITGDCVFDGASDGEWARFDEVMAPIRDAGIPAIAAFGNHERWLGGDGESRLFARFPHLRDHAWYSVAFGPLRLVVLESNEDRLDDDEKVGQREWYERTLALLDDDPAVRGVFVLMHHPPYTNSTVTSDERNVQMHFVPAFMRAKKTMAMLTGHVHSYERFLRDGKMFVVSGGGGGPRARLLEGAARRHPDDLVRGPALRDFHFIVYTLTQGGVRAEVRGVSKGGHGLRVIDEFELRWAQ